MHPITELIIGAYSSREIVNELYTQTPIKSIAVPFNVTFFDIRGVPSIRLPGHSVQPVH